MKSAINFRRAGSPHVPRGTSTNLTTRLRLGRRAGALVIICALSQAFSGLAATITWTGAVSSDWNNRTNWSPQQVPTNVDTAVINSGNVTAAADVQFGTLNFNGGNLSGPIKVATNGVMNWTGGRLTAGGSITVETNGLVTMSGSAQKELAGPLTNYGRVVLSGSGMYVLNNNTTSYTGYVTNRGSFEVQGDYAFGNYWDNVYTVFGNGGTLRKTAGAGVGVIGPRVVNGPTGLVQADTGTMRFEEGMWMDGTFTAAAGTVMEFKDGLFSYMPPSRFGGAGQYRLTGGTMEGLNDYLSNLALQGGTVVLSADYQTNGVIVRLDLAGAALGGTSNRVVGELNASGGEIRCALDVASGGTLNLTGTYVYGATGIKAGGIMNWSSGRFAPGSSLVVEAGALASLLTSNTKEMAGPMSNYGQIVHSGGTLYLLNDGASYQGTLVNLGGYDMQGDVTVGDYWGNGRPTFHNGGLLQKSSGVASSASSMGVVLLNEAGTVSVLSGVLRFDRGQALEGLYAAEGGGVIRFNAGTFTYTASAWLTGAGRFELTGGMLVDLPDYMPNLYLQGGTVMLSETYQTNGAIARLDVNGATLVGANQVSGVLNFNSGFVSGAITVKSNGVLNWSGGRFAEGSSLLVEEGGMVNLPGTNGKELGGPLTNYGVVNWTGGTLTLLSDGGTWAGNIQNRGMWDMRSDAGLNRFWVNDYGMFQNYGTMRKAGGTGTTTIDVPFLSQSEIEALSGVLSFTRGFSATAGKLTFGMSNHTAFGRVAVTGNATVNGNVEARLLDGYIPPVGTNFGVLTAGSISGVFTNTDGLNVGFGRTFTPVYTATTLTLQTVGATGANNAPTWADVPDFTIVEGQSLLYTNAVTDPDGHAVLFKLLTGPTGAMLNLTNGVLSWTPAETQGGTSNYFRVRIFDSGNPSSMATQAFYVLVQETNTAPVLPLIVPQMVGVGGTLTVTNTATDADAPANTLSYQLISPPVGMTVSASGVISWTPGSAGSYQVRMRVTDNGVPALSTTNEFNVGVLAPAVPPAGLVSWWTGNGTTADANGLNSGTLSGAASYGAGLFGEAFNFTGGYLTVLDSASLDITPGSALTVEMWARRHSSGSVPYYFGKRVSCGAFNYQSPSDRFSAGTTYDAAPGVWRHYAWVFTGTEMVGYVNGAEVCRLQGTVGAVNDAPLLIGASGTCGSTFSGLIDEARVYNRALSALEVRTLYGGESLGAPVIVEQPESKLVAAGSNAVFTVEATGQPVLNYQWLRNGLPMSGATSSTLALNGVTTAESGNYSVQVSNAVGAVTSPTVELTVLNPPVITVHPVGQSGSVGGAITLTTAATGSEPLALLWRKNGSALSGATRTSLTLNNLQVSDAGNYEVVAYNWVGRTTSAVATVTVSAPIVWTGAASVYWTNPANWNPMQVPTGSDTAVVNSGDVSLPAGAQFYALTFNGGTLSGPLVVRTNCIMNWNGGRLTANGSVTVQAEALVKIGGTAQKELACPFTNYGRVVLGGTSSHVLNNSTASFTGYVTNHGIFEVQGDYTFGNYWNTVSTVFANGGTLRKTAGTGVGVIGPRLVNGPAGVVQCQTGTLRFDEGALMDGAFAASAGTIIEFKEGVFGYVPPSRFGGVGQYRLTGGTLDGLNDYLPNLQLQGGTVVLSSDYQTNGLIVRLDLNGAALGGTSNRVTGVLNITGGEIRCALDVAAAGVLNMTGTYVYGATAIKNGGTLNWSSGRFAPGASLVVEAGGLANLLTSNSKEMAGPMSNYGQVVHSGGTFYILNNAAAFNGSVVSLGSWDMAGNVALTDYWGNGLPSFGNGGVLRKSAGTGAGVIDVVFYNTHGAVEVWSGTLRFDRGQQLDGSFTADAGTIIQLNAGTFSYTPPGRFLGAGTYRLTGGTLNGLHDWMPNWQLTGGIVILSPSYQTNGTVEQLDLTGATLGGANEITGTLNFNSGLIAGMLTVKSNGVLNWNTGRFGQGSSLVVESNAVLNLVGGSTKELGGPLTNHGTVNSSGGTLYVMNDGGSWAGNFHNFGVWEQRSDATLEQYWGNNRPLFRNYGVLRKVSGTGNSTMNLAVTNRGTIEALSGTILCGVGLNSPTGTMRFGLSTNTAFGRLTVSGTANLQGSIGARLLGGYIPPAGQNFQVISAGTLTGTFTDTNGLVVGFGRVLSPTYTATTLTLQATVTNGINAAPEWAPVPNFTITEGQTLLYTNEVTDPDGDQVLFALNLAPTGANLGLTNGVLQWTPTAAQGGTSNYFVARVFDSGNPSLMVTQTFYVRVMNTNTAPVLPSIPPQLVGVGGVLTVTNGATDADLPVDTLSYELISPPAGMSVNGNGVITWAPGTPGHYMVKMRVTDNGVPPLSTTNTFTVGVVAQPVPAAGLVSWWTGNGTTADSNGLNDGTLAGAAGYGPGLFGQAFVLSGGYLTVPGSGWLDFAPGSALTMEMWVKRTQASGVPYYFGKRVGCGSSNYQSPSDVVAGAFWNTPVGQWRHLVWVFTGKELVAYVDGAEVLRMAMNLGPVNGVPLLIGASGTCGSGFIGLIDEARLYNRALTFAEVQGLYSGQSVGAPVLVSQPASQMVASGATVVLSASATGAAPLNYQWWYDGTALPGQTAASLTLPGITVEQSGEYSVVVSNPVGVVTSEAASLAVIDAPKITVGPLSQVGIVGASVTFTVEATGTPTPVLTYQWRKNGVPLSGRTTTALPLLNLQVSDSGNYDVVVGNWAGTATSLPASLLVSTPIVWNGSVSTDWHNRTNWTPQQVPTSADTALINSGNVSLTAASEFYALTVNGGTLFGEVRVNTNTLLFWNAGAVAGSGSLTVRHQGVAYLTGSGVKELSGRMTNFGRVVLGGSGFTLRNDNASYRGTVTNLGTWEVQGDYPVGNHFANAFPVFGNSGMFRKTAGAGISYMGPLFVNGTTGVVSVESGTLRFERGARVDGTFHTVSGAVLNLNTGTFEWVPTAVFSGAGQFRLTGGTLEALSDFVPNFQLLGGTVNLSPTYQTNGVIARLDLNGSTLGGTSNRVVGVLNASGGSISGVLELARDSVANLSNNIYLNGPTLVRTNATMNWASGRVTGGLLVESNALVNLVTTGQKELSAPMTNFGRVAMIGGTFYVLNNNDAYRGGITNAGIWEMQADVSVVDYWDNGLPRFGNGGWFGKTGGPGVGTVSLPFVNNGTVICQSGMLRFDRGMRLDGSFMAAAGTSIFFNGGTFVYVPPNRFTGAGVYALTGGILQELDDYLPNFQLRGGTVNLSPNYMTNGPIVRLDMNGATLAGSNYVIGVLNATNGAIAGALTVAPSAVLNLDGTYAHGGTVVRSNATFNWLGGRFAPGSWLLVQSNAAVNLASGVGKELAGPMTNYGHVAWSGGTLTLMNENASYLGQVVNSGLWEMQGNLGMNQYWYNGHGKFGNAGTFRKSSGSGTGTIGVQMNNVAGIVDVTSGTLRFDDGLTLSGEFKAEAGTIMQFHAGTFVWMPQTRLTGPGIFRLTGGALQGLADYLPNFQLKGGTVSLSPTYQTNGPIVQLDLDGATLLGSNAVAGVMNLLSGYVGGPLVVLTNGTLNWSAGRFAEGSSLIIHSNGLANMATGGAKELGGAWTNFGLVQWTGGSLNLLNDASAWRGAIVNSGIWETRGDLNMGQYWVNNFSSFQNNGTLRKTTGGGTATMDLVFVNQGVVEPLTGIWTFGRNFSLTEGTVRFGISGDTSFGRINLTGTASLAGKLGAQLLGGYVPAVGRTFQVMNYGVVAGSFTDYSGLDVGFGRAFTPIYSVTSLTLQAYATNLPTEIVLSGPALAVNGFSFLLSAEVGKTYTVQYCTNLAAPVWSVLLTTNIPTSPALITDGGAAKETRFYRAFTD